MNLLNEKKNVKILLLLKMLVIKNINIVLSFIIFGMLLEILYSKVLVVALGQEQGMIIAVLICFIFGTVSATIYKKIKKSNKNG